jgi:predicted Zn-dependent peptidase
MSSKNFLATLENGLTVIGEVNPNHQSCGLGYFVKTGARDETKEEAGISHFLEHMMFKGTAKRSALDVSFDLGNIGAQANAFTSEENTVYYSSIIPEYFAALHELLSDMLKPSLVQAEFDTEKNVILEEIALYQDRPQFYLYENANTAFFEEHPLANSVLGTTQSVSAITSSQMRSYYERRYSTSNMVLAASGNFDWDAFLKRTEVLTKDWKDLSSERKRPIFMKPGKDREFKRKNLSQAHVLFFSPSCAATDAERYALSILSVIIGDGTGSKFFWKLIDSGLAESASAEQDEKDNAGVFSAYAGAEPEKIDEVAGIIKNILNDVRDFTGDELDRAKAKVVSRLILGGELPMGRLMALGMEWNYRQQIHSLKAEIERFKEVSANDILKALDKYPFKFSEYRLLPE